MAVIRFGDSSLVRLGSGATMTIENDDRQIDLRDCPRFSHGLDFYGLLGALRGDGCMAVWVAALDCIEYLAPDRSSSATELAAESPRTQAPAWARACLRSSASLDPDWPSVCELLTSYTTSATPRLDALERLHD